MNIKLPFVYPPIMDSFSGSAGVVGIMMLDKKYKPLILINNFLTTYDFDLNAPGFNWAYYNNNYNIEIDVRNQAIKNGVISTIENSINHKYYVQLYLDHMYLSKSDFYGIEHFLHDCATIIGYDSERKLMYVADNFKYGKYTIEEVGYEEIENARKDIANYKFVMLRVEENVEYNLSRNELKDILLSYKNGKCYLDDEKINIINAATIDFQRIIYGVELYDIIKKTVVELESELLDIRSFRVLYNHMCLYYYFIEFLDVEELYKDVVGSLVKKSKLLPLIYLKIFLSKNFKYKVMLLEKIDELRKEELDFINILLCRL